MPAISPFQFQYGSIGSAGYYRIRIFILSFNSSMVRLGVQQENCTCHRSIVSIPVWFDWEKQSLIEINNFLEFQFQYGSIGSLTQETVNEIINMFQFQYGSIGSDRAGIGFLCLRMFQFQYGSIGRMMPRLTGLRCVVSIPVWFDWEISCSIHPGICSVFQFQYGSIGSLSMMSVLSAISCFNSSMVRLGVIIDLNRNNFSEVSIPVWFDWEFVSISDAISAILFQFQYGSIGRHNSRSFNNFPISFNSSMVRLGEGYHLMKIPDTHKFQFQYGSIGSYSALAGTLPVGGFNSSMVRLGVFFGLLLL